MELDRTRPLISPQTNQSSRSNSKVLPARQERSRSHIKITYLLIPLSFFLLSLHSYFFWISTDPAGKNISHRSSNNHSSFHSYSGISSNSDSNNINDDNVDQELVKQIMKDVDQSLTFEKALHKKYDVCVVGAGLSGSVIAERIANGLNKKVLIIDKRDHIGGNCHDYTDEETGIRVNMYGAHLFHTNSERVWDYVQKFSKWTPYEHKVLGYVNGSNVPIPVNIDTVNTLFHTNIQSSEEMDRWLEKEQVKYDHEPVNSEEMAMSRVGKRLYELIFKGYTYKQWARYPSELGPEVTARIPVRNDWDDRYFPKDKHQALPSDGYTRLFENLILNNSNIDVFTGIDYFKVRDKISCGQVIYTGPIDAYFSKQGWPALEYRSLDFERKVARNTQFFQPNSVVNHPSSDDDFTRIVEYKHFLNQTSPHTVYYVERSKDGGEPYYPVPNKRNKDLFAKYQTMANSEDGVFFVGRLANYKYFNMDEAILNALELFDDKFVTTEGSEEVG